ncbi:MAG TPA: hypothetical protein PLZ21_13195, partial [Armatimonadota bacterium]|nr:hypothetical protein [Armatimonadota bacterium]
AVAEQLNIDFVPFYEEVARYYHPCDPVEEQLVNRIARCMWRLARAEVMESRLLDRNPGALKPGLSIQKVMEYERITDLQLHRAIRAFERKRSRRY